MPQLMFPEFRDEQGPTKYPFADGSSLTTTDGLRIEDDTFLDAVVYPVGGRARQYISRVRVSTRSITLVIGDPVTAELAVTQFDPLDPPDMLKLTDAYGRPAGVLVSEAARLAVFQTWSPGEHQFAQAATELVASCVIPMPEVGIRGIATEDGTLFTGEVWIVGENGVVVRSDSDGAIRIDVIGDPMFRRRLCSPTTLFVTPRFVRTINHMPPDAAGDFKITVGGALASNPILRVFPDDKGGLTIEAVGQTL